MPAPTWFGCAVPRDKTPRRCETIVARVADPGDRRHPLQPHPGAQGDRSRRPLHPAQPRQHRRPRQSRRGRASGASRGRSRCGSASTPARCPSICTSSSARRRSRRWSPPRSSSSADGVPRLRRLQGLDQVDQRAEHDRRQPAARGEDPLPAAPRRHRGRDQMVGLAEIRGRHGCRCSPTGSATRSASASPPSTPRRRSRSPGRSSRRCSCASAARC